MAVRLPIPNQVVPQRNAFRLPQESVWDELNEIGRDERACIQTFQETFPKQPHLELFHCLKKWRWNALQIEYAELHIQGNRETRNAFTAASQQLRQEERGLEAECREFLPENINLQKLKNICENPAITVEACLQQVLAVNQRINKRCLSSDVAKTFINFGNYYRSKLTEEDDDEAFQYYSNAYNGLIELDEMIRTLGDALEKNPLEENQLYKEYVGCLKELGQAFYQLKKYERSELSFKAAIEHAEELEKNDLSIHLGQTYYEKAQQPDQEDYQVALEQAFETWSEAYGSMMKDDFIDQIHVLFCLKELGSHLLEASCPDDYTIEDRMNLLKGVDCSVRAITLLKQYLRELNLQKELNSQSIIFLPKSLLNHYHIDLPNPSPLAQIQKAQKQLGENISLNIIEIQLKIGRSYETYENQIEARKWFSKASKGLDLRPPSKRVIEAWNCLGESCYARLDEETRNYCETKIEACQRAEHDSLLKQKKLLDGFASLRSK
jgi:hypothetical protein